MFISLLGFSQVTETILNANWKFKQVGSKISYPAIVPGTVHTDLLENKLIKDPYLKDNEKSVQWVENEDWEYIGTFKCDKKTIQNKHVELNFEGLDTYAKVFLNGVQILDCNNMFRSWNIEVKQHLKIGENQLQIIFESSVNKGKAEAAKLNYTLPGDEKVFTRKAQYQYGWDWGPRLVTCGIYKPIKLICWDNFKVESIKHIIENINDSKATLKFILQIKSEIDSTYNISINSTHNVNHPQDLLSKQIKKIHLHKGLNTDTLNYTIQNPQLWYPNGITHHAACYTFNFDITTKKQNTSIIKNLTIGLRTIELVRAKDFFGESFYFKINGKVIFMKGANYIPQDNFVPRTTNSEYKKIISLAKDANMNMLRVWGGGVYPSDEFYEECNRNGILVWQDFMFACAMYPGDTAFVENVKQEVKQQVQRIQNHPCLALWCGNNEIDEGWKNWGWQNQYRYSKQDSLKIWNDYKNLFQETIPAIIKQINPAVNYWPSSPSIGWGHKESLLQGDSHYWGVWWGMDPFDVYEKKVGRFMSEYGFQGMPDIKTFKTFCDTNELTLNSTSVKAHQKHPTGYQTIQTYMERDYIIPSDFKKYIYVSQLLQRDGIKTAIEAHHRAMPYCMGTLYWQLNDCWPVTSWSAIDYTYKPKALYYETKKLFNDVTISVHEERGDYNVYIISDKLQYINGKLNISLKNIKGDILFQKTDSVHIASNSSAIYYKLSKQELVQMNLKDTYLSCELKGENNILITKNIYCFVKPKELNLQKPDLKINYLKDKNVWTISSNTFTKDLYLFTNQSNINFSDNYFDLEPNQAIEIKSELGVKLSEQIQHISLYDVNQSKQ